MQRNLLLLLLILLNLNKGAAQITADFPDSNYYWNEFHKFYDLDYPHNNEYYFGTMFDAGDTVLNNISYRKIVYKYTKRYYSFNSPNWNLKYSSHYELVGLIRNDKLNKKVYFTPLGLNFTINNVASEVLLYDFNLKVGDKYPTTFNNIDTSYGHDSIVIKIDTITDPLGIKRAVYYISNDTNYFHCYPIVQGFGNCGGLLNPTTSQPFEGYLGKMTCISVDKQKISINSEWWADWIYLDLDSTCTVHQYLSTDFKKKNNIQIYPNPISTTAYLEVDFDVKEFTLVNSLGQSFNIPLNKQGEGKYELQFSDIDSGLYSLIVNTGETQYISRIIKL